MTLYELNEELRNFELEIDEETGEILNASELDSLKMERDTKIENIGLWIKNLLSDAEELKREKENLYKREQAAKNKAERLKEYLKKNLNGEKFKTPRLEISYRRSESVEVEDMSVIPEIFLTQVEPKVNKMGIKQAFKEGIDVPGIKMIVKNNMTLR